MPIQTLEILNVDGDST